MENETKRVAVYIDLNNIEESMLEYRECGMYLDYSNLIVSLIGDGELTAAKAYDSIPNNQALTDLHNSLAGSGIDMIEKRPQGVNNDPTRTCKQKEVDTSMVADIIGDAYEDVYDVCYIVSGDRDMNPAKKGAERAGKDVVIVGFEQTMGEDFRSMSSGRIYLDDMFVLKFMDSDDWKDCVNCASANVLKGAYIDA